MTDEQQVEQYLSSLRTHLGTMPLTEREEILREIHAHIRDSAEEPGNSLAGVLARLGPANELAVAYHDGLLIRQASHSFSPFSLMRAAFRIAARGVLGTLIFVCGFVGYITGFSLVLTALLKPLFPDHTGLWTNGSAEHLRFLAGTMSHAPQPPMHEILGWRFIPIALTVGALLLVLTTFAIRFFLRISRRKLGGRHISSPHNQQPQTGKARGIA
ncbi:MAG TPA: DUF1700 domain-containing protein [Granulicella sp.]|jgi:uncharacterized membrane protein